MASIIAAATVAAVWSWGRCSRMVKRVLRSTRVPMALRFPVPMMRSPSQCPGHGSVVGFGRPIADGEDLRRGHTTPVRPGWPCGLRAGRLVDKHLCKSARRLPRVCTYRHW